MKTEVYSWRLSAELKAELEREARIRKVPVSTVLELALRDWLKNSAGTAMEEEAQNRLHAAASRCFGVLASGNPRRAETARETIRKRLAVRHTG
jgi:post-segregation antitoxin (ccd killing protein)